MHSTLTRRTFSRIAAGSLLTGGLLEAAIQEVQTEEKLSPETAEALLEHIGYPAEDGEMETLKPMLEEMVEALQKIRDFEIPLELEPSFVFHPDR